MTETGALASSSTPICTPSPAMMPITADWGDVTASAPGCGASATAVIVSPLGRRILNACVPPCYLYIACVATQILQPILEYYAPSAPLLNALLKTFGMRGISWRNC